MGRSRPLPPHGGWRARGPSGGLPGFPGGVPVRPGRCRGGRTARSGRGATDRGPCGRARPYGGGRAPSRARAPCAPPSTGRCGPSPRRRRRSAPVPRAPDGAGAPPGTGRAVLVLRPPGVHPAVGPAGADRTPRGARRAAPRTPAQGPVVLPFSAERDRRAPGRAPPMGPAARAGGRTGVRAVRPEVRRAVRVLCSASEYGAVQRERGPLRCGRVTTLGSPVPTGGSPAI